jgi:hypothetical protein
MRLYSLPGSHILPGQFFEAGGDKLACQEPSREEAVYFGRPKTRVPNGRLRNSVLNSSANIMIVTDLECPDLPQPYDRLHPAVKRNPDMTCEHCKSTLQFMGGAPAATVWRSRS